MTDVLTNFIIGFVGGIFSGDGIGVVLFRKNIFSKDGSYVIGGVTYRSLQVLNNMVLKEFAKGAAKSMAGCLMATFKNYIL